MKKLFTFLLALVLIASFSGAAYATNSPVSELISDDNNNLRLTLISSAIANLSISSGTATMSAALYCVTAVDNCSISAYIQRSVDGSWVTLQHYTSYSNSNSDYWSASKSVTSGYSYRLLVYYYAYDGDLRDSTSRSVTRYY